MFSYSQTVASLKQPSIEFQTHPALGLPTVEISVFCILKSNVEVMIIFHFQVFNNFLILLILVLCVLILERFPADPFEQALQNHRDGGVASLRDVVEPLYESLG